MHGRACKQCSFGPITRLPSVLRFLGTIISPASVKKKTTVIGHFQVISWQWRGWKKRVKQNAWQREKKSSILQARYTETISFPVTFCPSSKHGISEAERREREGEYRDEGTHRGMEQLCQRQRGSSESYFVLTLAVGWWLLASGDQRVKEWCRQILEICRWSELSSW